MCVRRVRMRVSRLLLLLAIGSDAGALIIIKLLISTAFEHVPPFPKSNASAHYNIYNTIASRVLLR